MRIAIRRTGKVNDRSETGMIYLIDSDEFRSAVKCRRQEAV